MKVASCDGFLLFDVLAAGRQILTRWVIAQRMSQCLSSHLHRFQFNVSVPLGIGESEWAQTCYGQLSLRLQKLTRPSIGRTLLAVPQSPSWPVVADWRCWVSASELWQACLELTGTL